MKQFYIILFSLLLFSHCQFNIKLGETYLLPEPEKEGGMPLNEALSKRQSQREYDETQKLSPQLLSQALWSCYGANRDNGLKCTPSAVAWFPLIVYIFLEDGVYKYDPSNHSVIKFLEEDYRYMTGTQTDVVTKAAADFVFIADFKKESSMGDDVEHKKRSIYLDTGHSTMALYLFAASNNLKGVARAMVDVDPLLELLGLNKEDYIFTLSFSLGF